MQPVANANGITERNCYGYCYCDCDRYSDGNCYTNTKGNSHTKTSPYAAAKALIPELARRSPPRGTKAGDW